MGLGPSLSIRQSQQLVLTPQLTQAIKLLQLSNLELEAFIAEELSKNPLLEPQASDDAEPAQGESSGEEADGDEAPDDPGADTLRRYLPGGNERNSNTPARSVFVVEIFPPALLVETTAAEITAPERSETFPKIRPSAA